MSKKHIGVLGVNFGVNDFTIDQIREIGVRKGSIASLRLDKGVVEVPQSTVGQELAWQTHAKLMRSDSRYKHMRELPRAGASVANAFLALVMVAVMPLVWVIGVPLFLLTNGLMRIQEWWWNGPTIGKRGYDS